MLTTEGDTVAEGFSELRLHIYQEVLTLLKVFLPGDFSSVYHGTDTLLIQGVEHITESVLVQVHPVSLIG